MTNTILEKWQYTNCCHTVSGELCGQASYGQNLKNAMDFSGQSHCKILLSQIHFLVYFYFLFITLSSIYEIIRMKCKCCKNAFKLNIVVIMSKSEWNLNFLILFLCSVIPSLTRTRPGNLGLPQSGLSPESIWWLMITQMLAQLICVSFLFKIYKNFFIMNI